MWTTLPVDADGDRFGRTLVEERLAACVSVQAEGRSIYRWQGRIESGDEAVGHDQDCRRSRGTAAGADPRASSI